MNLNLKHVEIIGIKIVKENLDVSSVYVPEENNIEIAEDIKKIINFVHNKKCIGIYILVGILTPIIHFAAHLFQRNEETL